MEPSARPEWALADVFSIVSDAAPDRTSIVWGDRRDTYRTTRAHTDALAAFLVDHGIGGTGPDPASPRWACAQDRVAVLLHNRPEHREPIRAAWRRRGARVIADSPHT